MRDASYDTHPSRESPNVSPVASPVRPTHVPDALTCRPNLGAQQRSCPCPAMPLCRSLLCTALLLATACALPPGMPANVTGTYGRDFDGTHGHRLSTHLLGASGCTPPKRTTLRLPTSPRVSS